MATAKTGSRNGPSRRRTSWLSLLLLAVAVVGAAYWMWREPIDGYAVAGTSYGAHMMCSCRYIGGRDMGSCKADFEPGMQAVFISEDEDERSVTAWVPLVSAQTARYREGYGCVLDGWND
ncbi:hypothetical protein [Alteraurantiacibacter buctensis]|uniref:Amidase n=1 Tax=Alteraurantiacibacter buctensis TaxID=1503981 RepID=A0A844YSQ7_9SPHN|nr:hypothetical protein [Alteraurantiacibacter buctensis]MXO70579.1 hypothetical protein [Alteraurantiacibacter buctensis]